MSFNALGRSEHRPVKLRSAKAAGPVMPFSIFLPGRTRGGGSEKKGRPFGRTFRHCSRAQHATSGALPEGLVHSGPKSKPNSGANGEFASLWVCELITSVEVNCTFFYASIKSPHNKRHFAPGGGGVAMPMSQGAAKAPYP